MNSIGDKKGIMFDLEEELKKLPDKPGVYIMHDAADAIIYVGKAVSLKNRVRQYFQKRVRSPKIERMISLIDHFEYIVVGSEMEALVLECNLIKENRPKYNTMLMDDKTYPFIKVTVKEAFPRVFLTRKHVNDGARYFGPYTNVEAARNTLEMLNGLYHTRKCRKAVPDGGIPGERACLYHHMKQCDAPCVGAISSEEYRRSIDKIVEFLDGNSGPIVKELEGKMKEAAAAMEFEKAAEYRDLISDIKRINQVQRVTSEDEGNRDVVGLAVAGEEAVVQVFFIRGGKLVGKEHYYMNDIESESRADILNEFVKQYYSGTPSIPKEILLAEEIPEAELIGSWLSERAGAKIYIRSPKRGEKEGYGWLSLIYLRPEFRRQGMGIQLLGRVIMHYRGLGRRSLRLYAAEDNRAAMAFYRHWGFEKIGSEQGRFGRVWMLEKKIGGAGYV